MNFIATLMGYGWSMYGDNTSNKSHQCRENRKKRFTRAKQAQRLARRINKT